MVNSLIRKGVHLNVRNHDDFNALKLAILHGHSNIAKILINAGANVNARHTMSDGVAGVTGTTPLHWAAQDNIELVRELIQAGAEVNAISTEYSDIEAPLSRTPLFFAATNRNAAIAEELIKAGAQINITDKHCERNIEICKEAGKCCNQEQEESDTPLYYAVRSRNAAVVKLLIGAEAIVNKKSCAEEDYPFHKAVESQNIEIIMDLIKAGAAINLGSRNKLLQTPLDIAIRIGNPNIVRMLLGLMVP